MDRIKELEKLVLKHKALYYSGFPEISDHEFDKLEDELKKLDPENRILSVVGSNKTNQEKIKHDKKMLSLDKTYELSELKDWMGDNDVVSAFKLDGISCSLVYINGNLEIAKTRGDGVYGENILDKVLWINEIPKRISEINKVEIRGELYSKEEDFFKLSEEMERSGLARPSSQRNIVAGLMGRKENLELCRFISFMAFDLIYEKNLLENEVEKYSTLKKENFSTPDVVLHQKSDGLEKRINEAKEFMATGEYQIDGIVFSYNKLRLHEELGETAHHPRYRIAFKFKGDSKVTKIKNIQWYVSRNGILTPVAEVDPVELSGAMISNVTLHNYGLVKEYNLKIGDEVEIIRSGEVIPKFLSVKSDGGGQFLIPETCPSCKSNVRPIDIRIFCQNPECPGKNKEMILHFIKEIGITDLSVKRLEELISAHLVKEIPDIYLLTEIDLQKIDKVKEKLSSKLIDSISKTKETELVIFLSAIGISGGAYNKCERIINAGFNTIEKVMALTSMELQSIDGFAEKSAEEFVQSLKEKKELIEKLIDVGFKFKVEEKRETMLSGLKICITGALSEKRDLIEDRIRNAGGILVASVSKKTDILVTNEVNSTSSKYVKAQELKIKIINENELMEMMK